MTVRRYGIALVSFVLAFLLASAAIGRFAGYPELGVLDDKLRYFAAHKNDYDLIFVGSSRIHRGVVPPLFDRRMAEQGKALRSFSFGLLGMQAHEAAALVRRVLELKPARLRWVVIEPSRFDPVIPRENRFKTRAIFWHDLRQTRAAWSSTLLLERSWLERADLLLTHGQHFAARSLALDRGFDLWRRARPAPPSPRETRELAEIVSQQGFLPYTEALYQYSEERRGFLADPEPYLRQVRELEAANDAAGARDREGRLFDQGAFVAQVTELEAAGIAPIYLIPATPQATPEVYRLHRRGAIPRLLAFNSPESYPELYDRQRRFDAEHLTQEGAELFTRLLAERFSREVF